MVDLHGDMHELTQKEAVLLGYKGEEAVKCRYDTRRITGTSHGRVIGRRTRSV